MGNLVTKLTTNSIELNESKVSDVVDAAVKEKSTPSASGQTQTKSGTFLKNIWNNYDPRSPSTFISRTPITMFRSNSAGKFNHQQLNESMESQVDLEILTPEEEESLDSNTDLTNINAEDDSLKLPDPRSPIVEIARTPIVATEAAPKKKDENLMKKLTDKLMSTAISNSEATSETSEEKIAVKKAKNKKNLIFEDDDNMDFFSTPPKKAALTMLKDGASRTPLSCVGNNNTPKSRSHIPTSTPKSKINLNDENSKSISRIPVSARRLH